jgi:hypothetical protein
MGFPQGRALAPGLCLWGLGLVAFAFALERDTPLFLNLGAGDGPYARGFRGGWERDGTTQAGATMFHWTEDGSRLEFPVVVERGRLRARMRLARFAPGDADITLLAGADVAERWRQSPRGFSVREAELGEPRGPLMLRFRSEAPDGEALGVALDWVEVLGAERILPRRELVPGLLLSLLAVPAAAAALIGPSGGLAMAVLAAWAGAGAVYLDRLGGLVAVSEAGLPALAALAVVGACHAALRRLWPEQLEPRLALLVPAVAVALASLALFHPFFHYPDVDTHARFLQAIRADSWTAFDPSDFQQRTGAWTRTIGGQRIAFPYAPFFHLAAWPFALLGGEVLAVKTAGVTALALTLLLAFGLGRGLGLPAPWAVLIQCLVALLPVTASRLTLALFPTLMGQALEILLGLHLLRRFGHLDGARDAAAATLFLFLAQAGYTGSLFNVAALVGALAAIQALCGERRRALRLLGAYGVAALSVAALLYSSFLPTLWSQVLPLARSAAAGGDADAGSIQPLLRLATFYDSLLPALALAGLAFVREAPPHARRYLFAAFAAGTALLFLRAAVPSLLRDAKDVEMLALPIAALTVFALRRAWRGGGAGRLAASALLGWLLYWSATSDVALYAARFVAVGR